MTNEPREKPQRPQKTKSGPQSGQAPQCSDGVGPDPEARKHMGRMLKEYYDRVAHEPVPEKFVDLLKQLEAAEPQER